VIGNRRILETACRLCRADLGFRDLGSSEENASAIDFVNVGILEKDLQPGTLSEIAGKASGDFIVKAVDLWRDGKIDAIATAPINKESLNLGGYDFPGHTEFLASLTGTERFAMSFFADQLRVVLLSTHLPITEAIGKVKRIALTELIEFTDAEVSKLLNRKAKIAVAGLNPHASENGKFGHEEKEEIEPAIAECAEKGIEVSGPYSPDTIFLRASRGEFDAVIALYHDQATIPVKAISFGSAVNVTLGLPLIRTSVDHGTAFDIAGKGIADPTSMKAAILLAGELTSARVKNI
jgi:4-hydroxythreonine-4-phosphate dehydrogenase